MKRKVKWVLNSGEEKSSYYETLEEALLQFMLLNTKNKYEVNMELLRHDIDKDEYEVVLNFYGFREEEVYQEKWEYQWKKSKAKPIGIEIEAVDTFADLLPPGWHTKNSLVYVINEHQMYRADHKRRLNIKE